MRRIARLSPRSAALTAAALAGAATLLFARPLRGQQGPFAVQASIPATASAGPTTDVSYSFPALPGFQLQRNPRVRVTDAAGQVEELLPMYIERQSPVWSGHRGLHTETYQPGTYRVSVEVDYNLPSGLAGTVAAPATLLTVPAR